MKEELSLMWDKLDKWYATLFKMLPNILLAIVIIIAVYYLSKGVRILTKKYLLAKWSNEELKSIFAKMLQFVVICLGFLFALSVVNLDKTVTSILAGVGIAGIAIGFAFQDIAANFISGLFMASNKPFQIGDSIKIEGIEGIVEELKLRTTTVRTFNGNHVVIPNTILFQNPLINYTSSPERRIDLEVGVSYNSDLKEVRELTVSRIKELEGIVKEKEPEVIFTEFAGSSINFKLRFWIPNGHTAHLLKTQSDAIEAIKILFDKHGIGIPFPITTIDLSEHKDLLKKISA